MTLATFAVAVVYLLLKFPHSNGTGCQSVVPIKSVERRENKTYTGKVYSFKSCDIFFFFPSCTLRPCHIFLILEVNSLIILTMDIILLITVQNDNFHGPVSAQG